MKLIRTAGLIGVGPLVGAGVGYKVAQATGKPLVGATAGVATSYGLSRLTLGMVARGAWTASNFVRIGTATTSVGAGTAAATVGAGLAAGVVVGTAIVALGEKTGKFAEGSTSDVIDLYTGQVSLEEYIDTVASIPESLEAIDEAWRAVPDNAAGIEAGTPIDPATNRPRSKRSWWEKARRNAQVWGRGIRIGTI